MVTPLREILKAAARAWGLAPAARLAAAQEAWPRIVGPDLAAVSAPAGLRGGRLRVAVGHAAVGQEIRLRRAAIVAGLARELGETTITDVVPVTRRTAARGGRSGGAGE